jgi:hypothetical protein
MRTLTIKISHISCITSKLPATLVAGMLFFASSVFGQLTTEPIPRQAPTTSGKGTRAAARTQDYPPLLLPFFDDFSSTAVSDKSDPLAGFPSPERWESSNDVWINEGLGLNAPTVNVATLDGLNAAGQVYSAQVLENGFRDALMSKKIDLSTNRVAVGERPGVYLSFFYQWQGNGEAPDPNDYFRVDFLTADSVWVTAQTITTSSAFEKDKFYQAIVQVGSGDFFHEKFRFRFRNYGRLSGPFDTWNIDYVYLNKGRNPDDLFFADRALASDISPVFGSYRSVPLAHFMAAPLYTSPQVDIQSLRAGPDGAPTDYNVLFTFNNYVGGTLQKRTLPYGPVGSKYPDNNLLPGQRYRSTIRTDKDAIDLNDPAFDFQDYFLPAADSIDLRIALQIFEPDAGRFAANDTLSAVYRLDDFYAYDDGTAEYAVVLSEPDDQVAYRFDLVGDQPQQLVGFDVYVPEYSVTGFTTANFFVMNAENGEPNEKITSITHVVRKTARDVFQRVMIEPVVVEGQFFIGWRGSFSGQIRIGLDFSNNTVDRIYEDINGIMENGKIKWFPNNSLTGGSLMIRPNFGEAGNVTGIPKERNRIGVYPNPSQGEFVIEGMVEHLEMTNASGQKVSISLEHETDRTRVTTNQPCSGLYILHIRTAREVYTEKIVIY